MVAVVGEEAGQDLVEAAELELPQLLLWAQMEHLCLVEAAAPDPEVAQLRDGLG